MPFPTPSNVHKPARTSRRPRHYTDAQVNALLGMIEDGQLSNLTITDTSADTAPIMGPSATDMVVDDPKGSSVSEPTKTASPGASGNPEAPAQTRPPAAGSSSVEAYAGATGPRSPASDVQELSDVNSKLERKIAELIERDEKFFDEVAAAHHERDALKALLAEVEQEKAKAVRDFTLLSNAHEALGKELVELREETQKLVHKTNKLQQERDEAANDARLAADARENTGKDLHSLRKEFAAIQHENFENKALVECFQTRLDEAEAREEEFTDDANDAREARDQLIDFRAKLRELFPELDPESGLFDYVTTISRLVSDTAHRDGSPPSPGRASLRPRPARNVSLGDELKGAYSEDEVDYGDDDLTDPNERRPPVTNNPAIDPRLFTNSPNDAGSDSDESDDESDSDEGDGVDDLARIAQELALSDDSSEKSIKKDPRNDDDLDRYASPDPEGHDGPYYVGRRSRSDDRFGPKTSRSTSEGETSSSPQEDSEEEDEEEIDVDYEIATRDEAIEKLQEQLNSINVQVEELKFWKERTDQLQEAFDKVKQHLELSEDAKNDLEDQVKEMREEYNQMDNALDHWMQSSRQAEQTTETLKVALEAAKKENLALVVAVAEAKADLEFSKADAEFSTTELDNSRAEYDTLRSNAEAQETAFHQTQNEYQNLKSVVDQTQKELDASRMENETLKTKAQAQESALDEIKEQHNTLNLVVGQIQTQLDTSRAEYETLRSNAQAQEIALREAQNDPTVSTLQVLYEQTQGQLDTSRAEYETLRRNAQALETEFEGAGNQIRALELVVNNTKNELDAARFENETLKNNFAARETTFDEAGQQYSNMQALVERTKSELDASRIENETLKSDLAAREAELAETDQQVERVQSLSKETQKQADVLVVRLKAYELGNEDLEKRLDETKTKLYNTQYELKDLRKAADAQQTATNEAQKQLAAYQANHEAMKKEANASKTEESAAQIKALQTLVDRAGEREDSFLERIKALEIDNTNMEKRFHDTYRDRSDSSHEMRELKHRHEVLEAAFAKTKEELAASQIEQETSKNKVKALESALEEAQKDASKVSDLETALEEAKQESSRGWSRYETFRDEIMTKMSQDNQTAQDLIDTERERDELKTTLDKDRKALAEAERSSTEYYTKFQDSESNMRQLKETIETKDGELRELRRKIRHLADRDEMFADQRQTDLNLYKSSQQDITVLAEGNDELRAEITELEKKQEQLEGQLKLAAETAKESAAAAAVPPPSIVTTIKEVKVVTQPWWFWPAVVLLSAIFLYLFRNVLIERSHWIDSNDVARQHRLRFAKSLNTRIVHIKPLEWLERFLGVERSLLG